MSGGRTPCRAPPRRAADVAVVGIRSPPARLRAPAGGRGRRTRHRARPACRDRRLRPRGPRRRRQIRSASFTVVIRCATRMRRPLAEEAAQAVEDLPLRVRVDAGEGVVEDEDARRGREHARQRDALLLPARERHAALADDRVEAVREGGQVGFERGQAHRLLDARRSRRPSSASATFSRIVREKRNGSCGTSPTCRRSQPSGSVADVVAVEQDGALVHVEQPRQQLHERRLARPRPADDRDRRVRPVRSGRRRRAPAAPSAGPG